MNKIAIICPYFGKLPTNIDLTIKSMEKNNFIDWFIITDDKKEINSKNVRIIYKNFSEICKLIKDKLGTKISNPYKLCDYKPTYGYLFYEIIKDYEYWGYCDLDIIFGDLSIYLNENVLKNYDKIYDLGHFSILKNNNKIIEAFKKFEYKGKNYFDILSSRYIFVFDETYDNDHKGINGVLEEQGYRVYCKRDEFADIDIKYNNFYPICCKKYKYYYFSYKDNKLFMYKLYDENYKKEFAYIHLQKRKNLKVFCNQYNNYIIMPKGFYNTQKVNNNMFYKINLKIIWFLRFRIKRKLNNFKRNKEIGERW